MKKKVDPEAAYENQLFWHHKEAADILRARKKLVDGGYGGYGSVVYDNAVARIERQSRRWHNNDGKLIEQAKALRLRGKLKVVK